MYEMHAMPLQIPADEIDRLRQVQTATVGHFRHYGFMDVGIQALCRSHRAAGTAVTISLPGSDSTLLHHIAPQLRRGDFLVIERCGDTRHACWGGVYNKFAQSMGLAGVVVDGAITDPGEMLSDNVPIWYRCISPVTTKPYAIGGRFNVPVSCGNVAVLPGDAILADDSGVLVMRRDEIPEVTRAGLERQEREVGIVERILSGEPVGVVSGASARLEAAMGGRNPSRTK